MAKIILIDTHPVIRAGLRTMLARDPDVQVVGEADTPDEAMGLIESAAPDVLILDATLLTTEAGRPLRQIKARSPQLRIVALSGATDSRSLAQSLEAGAVGYVTRDCGADELSLAVRTVIDRKVYLSPRVTGVLVDHFLNNRPSDPPLRPNAALTRREQQVVRKVSEGLTSREIAAELTLSVRTIDALRQQVMDKLGIRTVAELTKYAIREGLTVLEA